MNHTIWKWALFPGANVIKMPRDSDILTAQVQYGDVVIWAKVALNGHENITVDRKFLVVGTGHALPSHGFKYIATAQMLGGELVWHVFEEV